MPAAFLLIGLGIVLLLQPTAIVPWGPCNSLWRFWPVVVIAFDGCPDFQLGDNHVTWLVVGHQRIVVAQAGTGRRVRSVTVVERGVEMGFGSQTTEG